ncbi:uncharacterized protein LOC135342515 [Halichondria panicea]|uniref:uncharacterized protein LOC135342515 n=1 Tax=Halichondria panicea TaxID=6063 RepID=UPI00312BB2A4
MGCSASRPSIAVQPLDDTGAQQDPADADRAADVPSQQPPNMQVFIGNRFPARQESYTSAIMFRRPQHIPDMFFSDSFSLSAAQPPDTGAAQQGTDQSSSDVPSSQNVPSICASVTSPPRRFSTAVHPLNTGAHLAQPPDTGAQQGRPVSDPEEEDTAQQGRPVSDPEEEDTAQQGRPVSDPEEEDTAQQGTDQSSSDVPSSSPSKNVPSICASVTSPPRRFSTAVHPLNTGAQQGAGRPSQQLTVPNVFFRGGYPSTPAQPPDTGAQQGTDQSSSDVPPPPSHNIPSIVISESSSDVPPSFYSKELEELILRMFADTALRSPKHRSRSACTEDADDGASYPWPSQNVTSIFISDGSPAVAKRPLSTRAQQGTDERADSPLTLSQKATNLLLMMRQMLTRRNAVQPLDLDLDNQPGVDDDNISSFLDLSPSEQATAVMHDLFFSAETPSMVQLSPLLCGGQPDTETDDVFSASGEEPNAHPMLIRAQQIAGTPAEYSPRDIPHSYFMKRRNATTITHQELIQDILALIQVDGARKKVSLKGPIASVLPPEKPSSTKRPKQRDPEINMQLPVYRSIPKPLNPRPKYRKPPPKRKNQQKRLLPTDAQKEFFKMLEKKINEGPDCDPTKDKDENKDDKDDDKDEDDQDEDSMQLRSIPKPLNPRPKYRKPPPKRKNQQKRLLPTDSQKEFFKMLEKKINEGPDCDPTKDNKDDKNEDDQDDGEIRVIG